MSAAKLLQVLRAEGVKVVEVGNWATHNRAGHGAWGPVNGIIIHHTVTSGPAADTVAMVRDGYASLPGPLCHGMIAKDGTVYLVGWGRANHAGGGDPAVLAAVQAESYTTRPPVPRYGEGDAGAADGNQYFMGFECQNLGDGKDPWPEAQLLAIERASAAICRYHGWTEKSVIGHLEWSNQKIDPKGFTMASMRARVKARLTQNGAAVATCRGMDVSAYQGTQNWASLASGGLTFAFAKASEGQSTHDPKFAAHIAGIKTAGLVAGAYHFAWPNQSAAVEAANYVSAVKAYAGPGFCHWLDLERYSDGRNYTGRTAAQIKAYAAAWMAAVQAAFPGQRVGVYTSASDLTAGHVPAGTTLWYPAYPGSSADTWPEAEAQARPKPSGWSPLIWQFTSTPASGPATDLSIAYLSAADFRAWAGATSTGDDMALTADDISKVASAVVTKLLGSGGALENSDLDRIWERDIVPAARPPYNNGDYFAADGKTVANGTWAAKYALQTGVEGVREALARVKDLQAATAGPMTSDQVAALAAALAENEGFVQALSESILTGLSRRMAD